MKTTLTVQELSALVAKIIEGLLPFLETKRPRSRPTHAATAEIWPRHRAIVDRPAASRN